MPGVDLRFLLLIPTEKLIGETFHFHRAGDGTLIVGDHIPQEPEKNVTEKAKKR